MANIKTNHIPQLDGLRGVAILLVISYHYLGFIKVFSFGWSGVDLFFVLSGFLITGKLLGSVNHPGYFKNFYRNRILRIFPLYYAVLFLFYAWILFFVDDKHIANLSYYKVHWKSFFLFTENWSFLFYGFPKGKHLLHFWSLAMEEQFYLAWPIIIYFLAGKKIFLKILVLLALVSLFLRCFFFLSDPSSPNQRFFNLNTFCRMDSFIAGAIISYLHHSKIKIKSAGINIMLLASFSLLIAFIFIFRTASYYANPLLHTFGFTLIDILAACVLYKSIQPGESMIIKILRSKLLIFFGRISYGLYIFHWLISVTGYYFMYNWGIKHAINNELTMKLISTSICLALSIIISVLSYYYFESYFLSLKKKTDA